MKLQCKICESTDFSYQNDMLVCNNCGCKYSVEEAQNSISSTSEKSNEKTTTDEFTKFKKAYIPTVIILLVAFTVFLCLSLPMPTVISKGFKYKKLSDGTYEILSYTKNKETVTIPSEIRGIAVTKISSKAFQDNPNIKTVIIPSSIKEIGQAAFADCNSIETMVLPFVGSSNTANTHLSYLFTMSNGISTLDTPVPNSLKNVYLLNTCTTINEMAFYLCESIRNVYLPESVKTIKDGTNSTTIGVNGNPAGSKYEHLPFYGCSPDLAIHCNKNCDKSGWGTYWNYINQNYSVKVYSGSYLDDNYELHTGTLILDATDHSIPKEITLNANNIWNYCSFKAEIIPFNYSSSLINPGYKQVKLKIDITSLDPSYTFENVQVTINASAKFKSLKKTLFKNETTSIDASDKKTVTLDQNGNYSVIFTFSAGDDSVVKDPNNIKGNYQITIVYGTLTYIK